MEEPLKYSKDTKYDSRRIVGVIFKPEQPEIDGITCIIEYIFVEIDNVMHVTEAAVYCAYPRLLKMIDAKVVSDQVKGEIEGMEANTQFEFKTVTIL